ncbi:hypothetical protein D3C86_1301340 [compost metagenome]
MLKSEPPPLVPITLMGRMATPGATPAAPRPLPRRAPSTPAQAVPWSFSVGSKEAVETSPPSRGSAEL